MRDFEGDHPNHTLSAFIKPSNSTVLVIVEGSELYRQAGIRNKRLTIEFEKNLSEVKSHYSSDGTSERLIDIDMAVPTLSGPLLRWRCTSQ